MLYETEILSFRDISNLNKSFLEISEIELDILTFIKPNKFRSS